MSGGGPFSGVPVWSAGVDWLTITSRSTAQELKLHELGVEVVALEQAAGNDLEGTSVQGYRGWKCGGAMVGHREDGVMLRLSGEAAMREWKHALRAGGNVTRLDLQATVDGGSGAIGIAEWHREQVREAARGRGRPVRVRLDATDDGGQTLYLGGRQSEMYKRCYDKSAEDPGSHPPGAWRYELEIKGPRAGATAGALYDQSRPTAVALSTVHSNFSRHGITPIFEPDTEPARDQVYREASDADRRLQWLQKHVGITFARVARESGLDAAIGAITHVLREVDSAIVTTPVLGGPAK